MNKSLSTLIFTMLLFVPSYFSEAGAIVEDELVRSTLSGKEFENPYIPHKYNYESTKKVPVRLSVIGDINSENDVYEGQDVIFTVCSNVYYRGHRVFQKGDKLNAKVSTIIKSGMNGIPASIIFSDFKSENLENAKFSAAYEKFGQDRSMWVFPLKWALTPFPPSGTLTNFIKGGHAKLKAREVFEIYFYPEW